jgi:site-specific DNA recombinase
MVRRRKDQSPRQVRRPRVAVYLRVSTDRQAANEISLVDQRGQLLRACADRGWDVAGEFSDAASAFLGKRPGFEEFLALALSDDRPFDKFFVHSLSRYSRDALLSEQHFRVLQQAGVEIVSLTEDIGGDSGWLLRHVIAMCNEQSSRETSKHVYRTRVENAKQGYWNGGIPPLGYKAEAVLEKDFGDKVKKRLVEDKEWSPVVREIFRLHREGDGEGHPLGATGIAAYLNRTGQLTRSEKRWYVGSVYNVLTNEAYCSGGVCMNRVERRTGIERPEEEWVFSPCPVLISDTEFEDTQARLISRHRTQQAPRTVTSDVLLGGIVCCGGCGGGMTAGTGTGRNNTTYNYYVCGRRARAGAAACESPQRMRREELDEAVLDAVGQQLLTPDRILELTNAVAERRRAGEGDAAKELAGAKETLAVVDKKLVKLVTTVIDGTLVESSTTRKMQEQLEDEKERVTALIKLKTKKLRQTMKPIDATEANHLSLQLRKNLTAATPQISRRYIRAFVSRVEVTTGQIVIEGSNNAVAEVATAPEGVTPPVQSFDREWRTGWDSNPRWACTHGGFQDRCLKPLGHLSRRRPGRRVGAV